MGLFGEAGPDSAVVLPSRIVSVVMPISVWGGGPAEPPQAAMVTSKAANAARRLINGGPWYPRRRKGPEDPAPSVSNLTEVGGSAVLDGAEGVPVVGRPLDGLQLGDGEAARLRGMHLDPRQHQEVLRL